VVRYEDFAVRPADISRELLRLHRAAVRSGGGSGSGPGLSRSSSSTGANRTAVGAASADAGAQSSSGGARARRPVHAHAPAHGRRLPYHELKGADAGAHLFELHGTSIKRFDRGQFDPARSAPAAWTWVRRHAAFVNVTFGYDLLDPARGRVGGATWIFSSHEGSWLTSGVLAELRSIAQGEG
jgi:hypothetical protein